MTKPILTTFQSVAPMFIQKYERYLPTAFDESMTLLEKMNKIIVYLNQIGQLTNDVVEQWNKVMEWLSTDAISEDVERILNQWVQDGTLDSLINETIFEELNTKIAEKANKDEVEQARKIYPSLHERIESIDNPTITTILKQGVDSGYCRIPFVEITNNGVVVAGSDFRANASDHTKIDIGVIRSLDNGKTWQDKQLVLTNNNVVSNSRKMDGTILINRNTNRIFVFGLVFDMTEQWQTSTSPIWDFVYKFSDDDGQTWSTERSLKHLFNSDSSVKIAWGGVGKGITMKDGTLVLPIQIVNTDETPYSMQSSIIVSTDGGNTWVWSGSRVPAQTSECNVVEHKTGELLLNARSDFKTRRIFTSANLGVLWEPHETDGDTLIEPNCQASMDIVNVSGKEYGLFLNPYASLLRENITLQATENFVNYYPVKTLNKGVTDGYGCLANYNGQIVAVIEKRGDIEFHDLSGVTNNIANGKEENKQHNMYVTAFIDENNVLRINPEMKFVFVDVNNSASNVISKIVGGKVGQELFISNFSGNHPFTFSYQTNGVSLNNTTRPTNGEYTLHMLASYENNYDINNTVIGEGEWLHVVVTENHAEIVNPMDFARKKIDMIDISYDRTLTEYNTMVLANCSERNVVVTLPSLDSVGLYHEIEVKRLDGSPTYSLVIQTSGNDLIRSENSVGSSTYNLNSSIGHRLIRKINSKWYII
jgi:hypothetical protein